MYKRPSILPSGARCFQWLSNGYRRHAFPRGSAEALCEAALSARHYAEPHAVCLACLHTIGVGVDWHDYFTFWNDTRGVVEPRLD